MIRGMAPVWPAWRAWPERRRSAFAAMIFALAVAPALAACGGGKESAANPQAGVVHSAPQWMLGRWKPLRLFNGEAVDGEDMLMTVTADKVEYYYPGCYVTGRIIMDKDTPIWASNPYRLLMDSVNCPHQWDIPTLTGQEDFGKIWAWDWTTDVYLFRSSDKFAEPFWTYVKI